MCGAAERPRFAPVGVLHNMSCRPSTTVEWTVESVGPEVVAFDAGRVQLPQGWSRSDLLAPAPNAAADALRAQLDAAWGSYGFRGAALVWVHGVLPGQPTVASPPPPLRVGAWARNAMLVLNVLARARGQLLMAHGPAWLEPAFLARRLATDDPRLVALARATGVDVEPNQTEDQP